MAISSPSTIEANAPIPFIDLDAQRKRIAPELERAIARVLEHGRYIMGPEVSELESALAAFSGAGHCIACGNGTDALTLVMMAEGIGPGDAIFTPSFTFVATAETAAQLGATPVFVDVLPETFNMDARSLERAIARARQAGLAPRMVIAVDLYGLPADYEAISAAASAHDLVVTADAAQSFGAAALGRSVGALADYTTTSFFPSKPLGCYGDGGAVFTGDERRAETLRSLRMHGQGDDKYDNVRVGLNSRLDTLQAAILLEKLKVFPEEIEARQTIAERYNASLDNVVRVPRIPEGFTSVWAQYTVLLPENAERDQVRAACAEAGVPTAVYYPKPLHTQTVYSHAPRDPEGMAGTDDLAPRVLSLPMHAYLEADAQDRVVGALAGAVQAG